MGNYFVSILRSLLGVNVGSRCGTMVGILGGEKGLSSMGQEDFIFDGK